jgi:hypothetical protein
MIFYVRFVFANVFEDCHIFRPYINPIPVFRFNRSGYRLKFEAVPLAHPSLKRRARRKPNDDRIQLVTRGILGLDREAKSFAAVQVSPFGRSFIRKTQRGFRLRLLKYVAGLPFLIGSKITRHQRGKSLCRRGESVAQWFTIGSHQRASHTMLRTMRTPIGV